MRNNYEWNHPLIYGDSAWVKKREVEPLVRSVRKLLDCIYEFGTPAEGEYAEVVEGALNKLVGGDPVEQSVHTDPPSALSLHSGNPDTCMHPECVEARKPAGG